MNDYPKAKYSKTHPVCVVQSEAEEKKLVGEWFDTPNFTNTPKPVPEKPEVVQPKVAPKTQGD